MNIEDLKITYVAACVVLIFIVMSPTLASLVTLSKGEQFSELYLLGLDYTIEGIPFNVTAGREYRVVVGTGNHMNNVEYYQVLVKLRNQTDVSRDTTAGGYSGSEAIGEYHLFLENDDVYEKDFTFTFDYAIVDNASRISSLRISGQRIDVDKIVVWDDEADGFFCQLLFELWIYNGEDLSFQFHDRSSWMWLNLSGST